MFDLRDYYLYNNEEFNLPEKVEVHTDDKSVLEFVSARGFYLVRKEVGCGVDF